MKEQVRFLKISAIAGFQFLLDHRSGFTSGSIGLKRRARNTHGRFHVEQMQQKLKNMKELVKDEK